MNIKQKVKTMTLEEKIGQKIMLDFRYWDPTGSSKQDMIAPDKIVGSLIVDNCIGGVILFSNNLKDKLQIKTLTAWYAAMKTREGIRLFIGTDNEGGNVFRLPRGDFASFPGNMALSAAITGGADTQIAVEQGQLMAQDMLSLHINTNFAPVVDVNTNPFNPVINVRAFSDDENTVSRLAGKVTTGMKQQGLITAYKHFPGHGSTSTDSHTGLPRVDRSRKDAFAIDLAPYKQAIDNQVAPDMVMTAHIQYPSLDSSQVITRNGEKITVPATMSREIQTHILRDELGYTGVTVSDALDMGAIADHFSQQGAVENVFAAGVDIALMPVSISSPSQARLLPELIRHIVEMVKEGRINEADIDASVERILNLKAQYNLLSEEEKKLTHLSLPSEHELEKHIADRSITVVINQQSLLPLKDKTLRYFILTPWGEQARGIAAVMLQEGYLNVVAAKETELNDSQLKEQIAVCDVFLLGTLSTSFTPVEQDGVAIGGTKERNDNTPYPGWLRYAAGLGKKRIHLSLRAPYDIVIYAGDVDAAVATYSYYGYDNGIWCGHSMISLAEVLTGKHKPQGKLPVNTWHGYDVKTNTGTIAFPRGYGLEWDWMGNRRSFLITSTLVILGLGITSSCYLRRKIMITNENTTPTLNNSTWLPNWRMQKSLDSALKALKKNCIKTVLPFWYEVNDAGVLVVKPGTDGLSIPDKTALDLLKKHSVSVTPTITTTLMPDNFIRLFSERSEQQRLAEAVRQEVLANGYDGIDLDLENIALTTDVATAKKVREIYTALCQRISSELSLVNKLLSVTVMARWSDDFEVWRDKLIPAVYDYKALSGIASLLRVMAYDQHAPNTPPGPIAGFKWVESICDWTRRNVCSVDRVEIGIPLYGRDWGGGRVKSILYDNVVELHKMYPQSDVTYSDIEKEETFTYVSAEGKKHTVWYSNNQSVTDRLALIRSYGFRGGAFWAASYESPTLWDDIRATTSAIV